MKPDLSYGATGDIIDSDLWDTLEASDRVLTFFKSEKPLLQRGQSFLVTGYSAGFLTPDLDFKAVALALSTAKFTLYQQNRDKDACFMGSDFVNFLDKKIGERVADPPVSIQSLVLFHVRVEFEDPEFFEKIYNQKLRVTLRGKRLLAY